MERFGNSALRFLAFPAHHSLCDGGSLPCHAVAGRRRESFLSSIAVATEEDLASVFGKFGGADQLRNTVNQFQTLLFATKL
jgi:hypothetical protein